MRSGREFLHGACNAAGGFEVRVGNNVQSQSVLVILNMMQRSKNPFGEVGV